jgi:phenylacetate-coenzyme A ligase PaaK-like adenylate-forming protein
MAMLAVSQDQVTRIVTLNTSGTSGREKRIFFTGEDLEATIDFFRHGMTTMVEEGRTVIIFLPGERPDSVGDLLARALDRIGVRPVIHGPIRDVAAAREEIMRYPSPCLVGIPSQILTVARSETLPAIPKGWVESVLLSADYVPLAIIKALEEIWACRVFSHYGMTEMGLGGGVECEARAGYHLRDADLYVEVVDPATGEGLEDGTWGEVVFTTLTRRAMPLVRYRTGDIGRLLPGRCPCGSVVRRLDRIRGRVGAEIPLKSGPPLTLPDLDEALFAIDGVLNYTAEVARKGEAEVINLSFYTVSGRERNVREDAAEALRKVEALREAFARGSLSVGTITLSTQDWFTTGVKKRTLVAPFPAVRDG